MENARLAQLILAIAHDLRSPLTSVKGFSATLLKRWDRFNDDQKLQFVETIHKDAERMSRMVGDVLDLARVASGDLDLYRIEVDVAAVTAEVVKGLDEAAERVEVDIERGLKTRVDEDRFRQIIRNLVESAAELSDDAPVVVRGRRVDEGTELNVDSKGEVPLEELPEMFAPRVAPQSRARRAGTGLALFLTRCMVEAHGGRISVYSDPGEGTTFTVVIPNHEAVA